MLFPSGVFKIGIFLGFITFINAANLNQTTNFSIIYNETTTANATTEDMASSLPVAEQLVTEPVKTTSELNGKIKNILKLFHFLKNISRFSEFMVQLLYIYNLFLI